MRKYGIVWMIIFSLTAAVWAGYWIYDDRTNRISDKKDPEGASIEVWVHSRPLVQLLEPFRNENPDVELEIRTFRSYEQLYDELMAAVSANMAPQIAEVDSSFGLPQLADTGALVKFDRGSEEPFHPAYTAPFVYRGEQWAVPLGGSVPVLYYNKDLLGLAGVPPEPPSSSWSELARAGEKVTKDIDGDGSPDIWGLVVDKELPWFFQNMTSGRGEPVWPAGRLADAFRIWQRFAHVEKIMPPLRHPIAASEFIRGRAGFFLASSDKISTLERYIGGKFAFDVLPMPDMTGPKRIPNVTGLVVLRSDDEKIGKSIRCVNYLTSLNIQAELLRTITKLPTRSDAIRRLSEDPGISERDAKLAMLSSAIASRPPREEDIRLWNETIAAAEMLETGPEADASELAERLAGNRP